MQTIKEYDENDELKEIYKWDKKKNKWTPVSWKDMILGVICFISKCTACILFIYLILNLILSICIAIMA